MEGYVRSSKPVGKMFVIVIALTMIFSTGSFLTLSPAATGTTPGDAIDDRPDPLIRLRYANFDPLVSEPSIPSLLKAPEYQSYVKAPCIVQSKGKVTEEWKAELEKAGAEIVGYIPDNALLVRMNQKAQDVLNQLNSVRWCGNFEPAYKVSPNLNGLSGLVTFDISFFLDGTNGPTVRFLRDNGAEFLGIANNDKVNKLIVKADASLINEIISHPDVKWISQYQQPEMCNSASTQLLQSGSTSGGRVIADDPGDAIPGRQINGDLKNDGAGFGDGNRKVVAVSDSGIRTTHEVWSEPGKVIDNYVPDGSSGELGVDPDPSEHGQATASMACGDAPNYVDYTTGAGDQKDGAAFGARLIFQDIGPNFPATLLYPPPDYYHDLFEDAQHGDVANGHIGGASVHSNCWSWGGGYNDESTQIDEYVWDNKDFLICFAAGNSGPVAESISASAEAKNCIAVGATDELGTSIMSFSSRGPTVPDGRIKPDLMAVGWEITTADNSGDTGYWADNWSGTSASTAGLAGHAILVQQYFEDGWYPTGVQINDNGFTPSAAMVKAAMINGAVDIGVADVPNMNEGWGRVHLENSLYFQGDARVVRYIDYGMNMPGTTKGAGLCTDDSIEYKFNVTGATSPFRVSLVWSDYKGDPAAAIMLVNDLDLTVDAPGGSSYKGNVFSGGSSQTGGSYDVLNNIECVYFSSPTAGEYTITINGSNIPFGQQDFALVVSGDMEPGYGIISMDRVEYTVQDTINLRVEDPNNPAGTVQVTLTSSGSGDSETFDLTLTGAGTGTFVGSINTEFNVVIADDGVLQVNNGDTVTATYSDTNPIHDSVATALIQTFGPVITNVRVEDIMGITAVVKWDTDIPSNSTVYYGTGSDSALWTDVQGDSTYTTAHILPLTGLTMETLYYFDVASSTQTGATSRDDFGGSHYTFSTVGPSTGPMIFYVDDDDGTTASDGTPYNEDWEANFDAFGWTYTRWDVSVLDTPTKADMEQAKMVVWTVQEGYPQIGATDRNVLGDYLEFSPDPKLYVVGQDVGWDMCIGTDVNQTWYEKHFHAIFERDDADGGGGDGAINVTGLGGDPISASYTSGIYLDQGVFGAGRFWPDDISNNGGTITWDYDSHAGGGNAAGIRANEAQTNAHTGYPGYRMVYEAWSHEMMGTWNPPTVDPIRSDVMDKSLIWLLGGDHPEVTLTYPTGGETLSGTEIITWSSAGSLNTKVFYSPNNGQAWHLLYEDPTGTATGYNWDTTTVDDGTTYQVRVLVTGVGDSTNFEISSSFAIDNGIDNTGPAVVAGSVKVNTQPTYSPSPATLTATITDVGRGNSNIVAAQYRIDGGFSSPMNPADVFDSTVENVTATMSSSQNDGDHLVEVRGQDMIGNWGAWSSFIWHVVNPDPPVPFDIDISMAGASNWVFISFPITATGDVLTVFNDTGWGGGTTDWDMIYWYDPSNNADHWKSYNKNYPGTQDMPNVYNTMGLWVHLTANDGFLTIGEGQPPSGTTVNLVAGWNLVGFPSQVEGYTAGDLKTDSAGLVTSIERFNGAAAYDLEVMLDGDAFQIGQAYWIYSTGAYPWLIP